MLQKGAVDDVETTRREMARPDGVVEYNPGFEPPEGAQKAEDLSAHLSLMQDARNKITGFANINPALMAQSEGDEHSGVAINLLQKAGLAELGSYLRNYRDWKIRVYRAVWNVVVNTWQSERWIRVGNEDENGLAQFLQVNGTGQDQWGLPVIVNNVGALDVDIALDEGPDSVNLMQDAFDLIKQLPPGAVPATVLIEFMNMPSSMKQRILKMMQQPVDPHVEKAKELSNQRLEAEVGEKRAGTMDRVAAAQKKMAEAQVVPHTARMNVQKTAHDMHTDTFKNFTDFLSLFQKTNALDPGNVQAEGST
jgi:hypothetical protein